MLSERRASPRVNVLDSIGMILVDVPSLQTTALLVDLSEHGLGVQFAAPLPQVASIDVAFPLGRRQVLGTCDAIWSISTNHAAGLRFRDLPAEDRAEIRFCLQALPATNQVTSELQAVQQPTAAPGNAQAGASAKNTRPEWAIRIATRRQQALADRLIVWRGEQYVSRAHSALVSQPGQAPEDQLAPGVIQEHIPAKPAETGSAAGVQPRLRNETGPAADARLLTPARYRRYLRATAWATVLILTLAGLVVLRQLNRTEDRSAQIAGTPASEPPPSQSGAAESSQPRRAESPPPPIGIIEVIEGKPTPHSDRSGRGRRGALTGGAAVVRDVPPYDDTALASRLQGDVNAVLTISDRGVVQEVRITRGNSVLARQVMETAGHWRFTPYFDEFGPVGVELPVIFRFRLITAAGGRSRKPARSN